MVAFYEEGALTTKKSTMTGAVRGALPTRMDKVIILAGWTFSPEKPLSGIGVCRSWAVFIPIRVNASQNRMFVELPLSIRILLVVKLAICIVTTSMSSCG